MRMFPRLRFAARWRRSLVWSLGAGTIALALGATWLWGRQGRGAPRDGERGASVAAPRLSAEALACSQCNVILISIDTLRADHLGAYGYRRRTSPEIDRFARRALVFENAMSQSAWTTPSHASMLTGLLPRDHGLLLSPRPGKLRPETPTLASILKGHGYRTVSFNGGGFVGPSFGLQAGFDTYTSRSRTFQRNISAAQSWLRENVGSKFFLFLHGYDVHWPFVHAERNTFYKPARDYDLQRLCRDSRYTRGKDAQEYTVAQYDAGIVHVDALMGEFFRFLHDEDLLSRSIVIITSDHGEELFAHGRCEHTRSVYRELVHVPLIVRLPFGAGGRIGSPVAASLSILPTVVGILGVDAAVDARFDLRRLLRDGTEQPAAISETARWRYADNGVMAVPPLDTATAIEYYWRGITTPDWRLIYSLAKGRESWELYDRRADAAERHNLFRKRADVVSRLRTHMFQGGVPTLPPMPGHTGIDEETERQIRALGYVQ